MRVGIVTFHFVNNFGGALQAYALKHAIATRNDADATIIDYRNWFIQVTDTIRLFPITSNKIELISGIKTMGLRLKRKNKFDLFMLQNGNLSSKYYTYTNLKYSYPKCDKYICGSDQIWNPYLTGGVSKPYYLRFVKERNKKISYASSFGISKIPSLFTNRMRKYINSLGAVSVREYEGIKLVEEIAGQHASQLIDPTFLLTQEEWNRVASEPIITEKYILLYIMQPDDKMYEYARSIKDKLGIQLVEISRYGYKPDFVDKSLIDIGPREFLGLLKNAEFICTNSYHGLVFSLIYDKDFYIIPSKRFRSRMDSLLDKFQIGYEDNAQNKILYDKQRFKCVLDEEREKAFEYLRNNIIDDNNKRVIHNEKD